MSAHISHDIHDHVHGTECAHTAIRHDGHIDYLHNGQLHHPHDGHSDEHRILVDAINPAECTHKHNCGCHSAEHRHGPNCGHEAVPHGNHVDYLVDGHFPILMGTIATTMAQSLLCTSAEDNGI